MYLFSSLKRYRPQVELLRSEHQADKRDGSYGERQPTHYSIESEKTEAFHVRKLNKYE